jgi:hypothetical protein
MIHAQCKVCGQQLVIRGDDGTEGAPATTGARTCQEARDTPGAGIGQVAPVTPAQRLVLRLRSGAGTKRVGSQGPPAARRSVAVHDGWALYRKYDCTHTLYQAHPLREVIFQAETRHAPFAPSLIDLLCEANTEAARFGTKTYPPRAPAPLSRTLRPYRRPRAAAPSCTTPDRPAGPSPVRHCGCAAPPARPC